LACDLAFRALPIIKEDGAMSETNPNARAVWKPLASSCVVRAIDPDVMCPAVFGDITLAASGRDLQDIQLGWRTVSFPNDQRAAVANALALADGTRWVTKIATQCSLAPDSATRLFQELYDLAVVRDASDTCTDAFTFHRHLAHYQRRLFHRAASENPLVRQIATAPTRKLVLGHLLDRCHWVTSAASHISPAIAHAPSLRVQLLLSEFLAEEYWHGHWLLEGLKEAGLSEDDVANSAPFPATQAQINLLRWSATTDVLAYGTCLTVTERVAAERARQLHDFWESLGATRLVPPETIAPFREHSTIDAEHGHDAVGAEIFAEAAPIAKPRRAALYRTIWSMVANAKETNIQVVRYYADEARPFYGQDI
jgi:hypothetical protein